MLEKAFWVVTDNCSWQNLMIEKQPQCTVFVSGNGKSLHLLVSGLFIFEIGGKVFFHEVGVVKHLQVDLFLRGDAMIPHVAYLQIANKGRNTISYVNASCSICHANEKPLQQVRAFQVNAQFGRRSPTFLHV